MWSPPAEVPAVDPPRGQGMVADDHDPAVARAFDGGPQRVHDLVLGVLGAARTSGCSGFA